MERALKIQIIPAALGFYALTFFMDDNKPPGCDRLGVIAWKLLIATNSEIGVIDGKQQYGDELLDSTPILPLDDGFEYDAIEHPGGQVQTKSAAFSSVDQWLKHEAEAHSKNVKSHIADCRKELAG